MKPPDDVVTSTSQFGEHICYFTVVKQDLNSVIIRFFV